MIKRLNASEALNYLVYDDEEAGTASDDELSDCVEFQSDTDEDDEEEEDDVINSSIERFFNLRF